MSIRQTVAPTADPVLLAEMKSYLRVDSDDDDTLITDLITAATREAEIFTRRQFVEATYEKFLDRFPRSKRVKNERDAGSITLSEIRLEHPPLASVTSVKYIGTTGDTKTLGTTGYVVDTTSEPGRILLAFGEPWPSVRSEADAVRIVFVTGYSTGSSGVPEPIRTAIKQLVVGMYDVRDPIILGTIVADNPTVERLLWSHRILEVA